MSRIFLFAFLILSFHSFAQVREIPPAVKTAFEKQYPAAEEVNYEDKLLLVLVHFDLDDEHMVASYNNKGKWKETEKDWSYDKLSEEVKTGFEKSKYADWKILETKIINRPGGILYRVKVEKNDIQKKHLFFTKTGRLVEDAITI